MLTEGHVFSACSAGVQESNLKISLPCTFQVLLILSLFNWVALRNKSATNNKCPSQRLKMNELKFKF